MQKKGFFYVPTWTLILFSVIFLASSGFELFFLLNADSIEKITVNGIQYSKGSEQYQYRIEMLRNYVMASLVISLLVSFISGFFAIKRIKSKNK